jgi:hypothetical protein
LAVSLGVGATFCGAALLLAQLTVLRDECRARAHDPYYTPFDASFWLNPYADKGQRAEEELGFGECVSWLANSVVADPPQMALPPGAIRTYP